MLKITDVLYARMYTAVVMFEVPWLLVSAFYEPHYLSTERRSVDVLEGAFHFSRAFVIEEPIPPNPNTRT